MVIDKHISFEVINSRKRWMFINLLLSLFIFFAIQLLSLDKWGWGYLLYSIWQFFVYGKLLYSELKTPGLNILSLFFMGAFMTVALPSYSYAIGLIEDKKFYCIDIYEITDFVFRTSAAMNIYYSIFILLLTRFSNNRLFIVDIDYIANKYNLFVIVIVLYLIAIIFRMIPFLAMISSTLDQFAGTLPLLVVFLLAIYCGLSFKRNKYYWLFLVILFFEIVSAFIFGLYKGTIIIYSLMYILYYYLHSRTLGKKLIRVSTVFIGASFLIFVLYIVYPFVMIKRSESGFQLNSDEFDAGNVSNIDILMRVLTFDYDFSELSGGEDNSSAFTGRMSAVYSNAFFFKDAYNNGHHDEMLKMSFQKVVPRFIWPNKPEGSDGNMTYSYMKGKEFDPLDTSSNYIGLFGGAYFWGGWFGAMVMCFINACVLSLLLKVCFSNLNNLFAWIIIALMLIPMMRCFEESSDGGMRDNVMFIMYALIIKATSVLFVREKRKVA